MKEGWGDVNVCCSSCSLGHFSWEKYLKETGATAAPSSCFKQVHNISSLNPSRLLWSLLCHSPSNTWVSSTSRASRLPLTSSRQGWSWRPRTRATPHPPASPRWSAWQARACDYAWTGPTTRTTSGAWWTRQRSSQSVTARRTVACCSLPLVRAHSGMFCVGGFLKILFFFSFCPLGVSKWQHKMPMCHVHTYK